MMNFLRHCKVETILVNLHILFVPSCFPVLMTDTGFYAPLCWGSETAENAPISGISGGVF